MNLDEKEIDLQKKILLGIKKTHERVLEFKKQMNTPLVVMKGDQIVEIKPWEK